MVHVTDIFINLGQLAFIKVCKHYAYFTHINFMICYTLFNNEIMVKTSRDSFIGSEKNGRVDFFQLYIEP